MFRVSVITLALTVAEDRDLPAVMAYDRIGHEDDGPDNVVLFLEVGALDEAVAEAALLSGQQVVGLKREEAVFGALGHGCGGLVMVELVL